MSASFRYGGPLVLAILVGAGVASLGRSEAVDKEKQPASPSTKATADDRSTYTVKKGPFKIEITLDGVFEAAEMAAVAFRPQEWTDLTVLKAVEQGTRVKEGDPLVWLDTKKIDEQIRDLQAGRELQYLAIKQTEEEIQLLEKSVPLGLASAERSQKIADEDLSYFLEIGRPWAEKSAIFSVKNATQYLEYQQEELQQLEKMYEADDLTEETEEIILKRARDAVERQRFYLESAKVNHDETLNIQLPRREESLKQSARQQAIALEKAQATLPTQLQRKRLELEKLRLEQQKADEKLQRLQKDRAALTLHAPADGVVYYGPCVRGQWPQAASIAEKLRQGGKLAPHEVFITIVQPRPLFVRAEVPEKNLQHVRTGLAGIATPVGYPAQKLPATVSAASSIPVSDGQFEARIAVNLGDGTEPLMPGMSCRVKLVPYVKPLTTTVPAKAVFTDELDDERHYVYLTTSDGEHQKRYVTIGHKTEDQIEVLEGLEEGDRILLEKPSDE